MQWVNQVLSSSSHLRPRFILQAIIIAHVINLYYLLSYYCLNFPIFPKILHLFNHPNLEKTCFRDNLSVFFFMPFSWASQPQFPLRQLKLSYSFLISYCVMDYLYGSAKPNHIWTQARKYHNRKLQFFCSFSNC